MSPRFHSGFTGKNIEVVTSKILDSKSGKILNIFGPGANIKIPIASGNKVPGSGIFLGEELCKQSFRAESLIEIGAGAYAPASFFVAAAHKKIKIDLVEPNLSDLQTLDRIIKDNNLENRMKVLHSSLFERVRGNKYDLIISNIAQMPLASGVSESMHDHGGHDGWRWIERIINHIPSYLNKDGRIGLLVFEFLGIIKRANPVKPSLLERLSRKNIEIISSSTLRRQVRVGGVTERSLPHILNIYPDAPFYNKKSICINPIKSLANDEPVFLDFYFIFAKMF